MPDQAEQTFSSLQELSALQRFGPATQEIQEKRVYSPAECAKIYKESASELRQHGFSEAGENGSWIGFKKGATEFVEEVWNDLDKAELVA